MQTAVQYLEDEEQMQRLYWQRAQAYRAASQFPAAERTLLAIRRWDAAVEMYKASSMYGDYLRLMKQRPDQLPAARAWVAQELEAAGHLRCGSSHAGHRSQSKPVHLRNSCSRRLLHHQQRLHLHSTVSAERVTSLLLVHLQPAHRAHMYGGTRQTCCLQGGRGALL